MATETPRKPDASEIAVLNLAETAAFLRVSEEAVVVLAERGALPAQRIGTEWRFLKRAVVEWLQHGRASSDESEFPPPWPLAPEFWDEIYAAFERRLLSRLPATAGPTLKPGSKQAVLRRFGVFKDDADLDAQLDAIRAAREPAEE